MNGFYDNSTCKIGIDNNQYSSQPISFSSNFTSLSCSDLFKEVSTNFDQLIWAGDILRSEFDFISPSNCKCSSGCPVPTNNSIIILNSADVFNPFVANADYTYYLLQSNSSIDSLQKYSFVYHKVDSNSIQYNPTELRTLETTKSNEITQSCPNGKTVSSGKCSLNFFNVEMKNGYCKYVDIISGPNNIQCGSNKQYCVDTTPYISNPTYTSSINGKFFDGTSQKLLRYADIYTSKLYTNRAPFYTKTGTCKLASLTTLDSNGLSTCGSFCSTNSTGSISSDSSSFTCSFDPISTNPNISIKMKVQVICS